MNNRVFRILVAVILVCCLVVSWSPIRAKAVGVDQFIGVAVDKVALYSQAAGVSIGSSVFCWVLLGLGLIVTTAQAIDLLNQYVEYSGELETSIYYYPDGTWSYGVDMGFVERIREFLFHEGYVVDASKMVTMVPEGVAFGNYTPRVPCVAYQYSYHSVVDGAYRVYSSGYLLSMIPNDPYVTSATSACTTYITVNDNKHYFKIVASGEQTLTKTQFDEFLVKANEYYHLGEMSSVDAALRNVFKIYGWTGIRGSDNVAIDYVAPLAVPMIEAYPEWHTNARPATNPDTEEDITVLPIPFNPSVDPETQIDTLTQPDIWQGSIAEPMPETDPDTGTDTDPDGGTSGDAPSTDIDDYRLDLTSFFPFCIPFDVARFVNVLAADPVAPRFEFELQLPFSDEPYLIVIDLAPFDSLAALARRLELLGFCIALAVATRNFYIRG